MAEVVTLTISQTENGDYLVVVSGSGFYQAVGKTVGARIRGEDEWFDDSLFGMGGAGYDRVLQDGSFVLSITVPGSALNEDWGEDEIYAIAGIQDYGDFRSNIVKGDF